MIWSTWPRRSGAALVAAAVCLSWCAVALASGDANRVGCPADTEASPGFRAQMPDCRAYEMVTPTFKAGAVVKHLGVSQLMSADGDRLVGTSFGGFAETENDEENIFPLVQAAVYEFSRTPLGWATEALVPPATRYSHSRYVAAGADLSRTLWDVSLQAGSGEELLGKTAYGVARRESNPQGGASFVPLGPLDPPPGTQENFSFEGASADLTKVIFSIVAGEGEVWPGDHTEAGASSLYEYSGVGNSEPSLVGTKNDGPLHGQPHVNEDAELVSACGIALGGGKRGSMYNAISSDASVVYFTALHGSCSEPAVDEIYARIDDSRTVPISEFRSPDCTGPCATAERRPAVFQGASEDGERVFFTTTQPLLDSDQDQTSDLYEAELGPSGVHRLSLISRGDATDPSPGAGAQVIGVARVAAEGSRVYFAARGVLTATANEHGEAAAAGGYNLFVADPSSGETSFVATLATPTELADEVQARCAEAEEGFFREQCEKEAVGEVEGLLAARAGVQTEDSRHVDSSHDGRFFVFLSARDLTGAEDTSTVNQAFEYDAVSKALTRVSVGQKSATSPQGYNDDGNTTDPEYAARILVPHYIEAYPEGELAARSVAEDGSVFFTSRNALTPQAVAGEGRNVYEYRDGNVYLLSAAGNPALEQATFGGGSALIEPGEETGRLLGANETGTEVFFATTDTLVPQDTDSQVDWYVARSDGGFGPPRLISGCEGDACQGPGSTAPPVQAPATATTAGGENLTQPTSKPPPRRLTRAQKLTRALRACRKKAKSKRRACEALARKRYGKHAPARRARKRM